MLCDVLSSGVLTSVCGLFQVDLQQGIDCLAHKAHLPTRKLKESWLIDVNRAQGHGQSRH